MKTETVDQELLYLKLDMETLRKEFRKEFLTLKDHMKDIVHMNSTFFNLEKKQCSYCDLYGNVREQYRKSDRNGWDHVVVSMEVCGDCNGMGYVYAIKK